MNECYLIFEESSSRRSKGGVMAATKDEIREWLEEGKKQGATHMIVICDTWDYDDYPRYVKPEQDVRKVGKACDGQNMQRVMEVYSYSHDLEKQLGEVRAFHYD